MQSKVILNVSIILLLFIFSSSSKNINVSEKNVATLSRVDVNEKTNKTFLNDSESREKRELQEVSRAIKKDPWQGYYDFLINEGSFKFWAVFQVATALVLIYSALAAVYYAKYNLIQADYDYGDYFFGRSDESSTFTSSFLDSDKVKIFQNILDAISSDKYS